MLRNWMFVSAGLLFIGCAPQDAAQEVITTELILTSTPLAITPEVTETPVPEPTPVSPQRLAVWATPMVMRFRADSHTMA